LQLLLPPRPGIVERREVWVVRGTWPHLHQAVAAAAAAAATHGVKPPA
jgi:hypothetical protein